jgi:glucosamine-6-phosphate deaminase
MRFRKSSGDQKYYTHAKSILVVKGFHKAEIVEKAILGPVTTEIPTSIVQLRPNCEILLNANAASRLKGV